ncbi:MAG TPA: oxidoreductase [Gammaproteobacteria bacterium]|jgi:NADPH2:quinone reductase|nr:oxidoreductase [Gammaproteobacteria bacterium]
MARIPAQDTAMDKTFTAFRIHEAGKGVEARYEQLTLADLGPGEVVVRVQYSSVNYKDALAATGKGKILRRFPLVGGIDLAGVVVNSSDKRYRKGQKVLVTGCGLGEEHDGGYAEYARVRGEWVIPMPRGFTPETAMMVGTAGFTAALAIHKMEHNGLSPKGKPVVVTGATGGVGSIAVNMLARRGYEVVAVTGKKDSQEYLKQLGASHILLRSEIDYGSRPLERIQWQGAIDNVGGDMLTWLTRTTDWWGNIASIGLAGGHELHTTVMPFILRGVNLLGINSMATPRKLRLKVWQRIATDLKPGKLKAIGHETVPFDQLPQVFPRVLDGRHQGRIVVDIGGSRG